MHRSTYSQQPHEPTTIARFQLAKFSYTTLSINHRGPLTWSHIFGNGNLFGVFESYAALSSTRVLFRVVHNGWETLEEIGITDLIKESEEQRRSQDSSRRPAFAVVVKLPCLAVKYPQGPGYVRRFQVKFSSDRDFYSALATLSDINCPFAESNVSSARPMSGPASSLSNLGQFDPVSRSQHCPSTATENSTSVIGMALPYIGATTSSTTAHPSGTAEASPSPPKTKKAASTQRAAKGRKPPKKDHTILPSSAPPEDLTKRPDQQTTTTTATVKTTSTPGGPFEKVGLPTPANLAKYTSEPAADRTASLQAWLCAHLEDPNFLQLCEDIEGIAERYYLGERRE
ncbi:uncharacterized protein BDW70DRAFT_157240 [Aspergillus foveolatus]|uniref:uncharacterized protein n=1 Tax=Aspergillus foveolatus TaxID=210207 RepID=UPI003CCCADD3